MRIVGLTVFAIALVGCGRAARPKAVPDAVPGTRFVTREYVDLAPGWRLQIVAPVTASGSYNIKTAPAEQKGNVITLKASDDLLGYETASGVLLPRPGGGVALRLTSAELTRDGKPSPIASPTRALIHPPKYARFLRVFYLTRRSGADHDMAIMGAARLNQLEPLTQRMRESPDEACANQPRARIYCEWIPAGMAVRPEFQKDVKGEMRWVSPF